jgi:hypothetical protein
MPDRSSTGSKPSREEAIRQELETLLSSQTFANAERQRQFLRYLVEAGLDGRAAGLKEFTIGIEVFDRPTNYDPRIDSTVRVQASKLRERLNTYYSTEGTARGSGGIRIELPKGGYSPAFIEPAPAPIDVTAHVTATQAAAAMPWTRWAPAAAALAILAAVAGYVFARKTNSHESSDPSSYQRLTFHVGDVLAARFAEDQRTILYSATWSGGPIETYTTALGSPESKPFRDSPWILLSVSKTGLAAILTDPRFLGPPFLGTLELRPLAGESSSQLMKDATDADFSPVSQDLAIARLADGDSVLEYPRGRVLYKTTPKGWISNVRVSRDGKRVAFADHRAMRGDDEGFLMVAERDGNTRTLGHHWTSLTGLAWSPSGREIWMSASEHGLNATLHAVDLEGRERVLADLPGRYTLHDVAGDGNVLLTRQIEMAWVECGRKGGKVRDLSWLDGSFARDLSANGGLLVLDEEAEAVRDSNGIYIRKTDGSPPRRLSDGFAIALSPDEHWILGRIRNSNPPHLILVPTEPGEIRTISLAGVAFFEYGTWFPEGRRLLLRGESAGNPPAVYNYEYDVAANTIERARGSLSRMPVRLLSPDGKYAVTAEKSAWKVVALDDSAPAPEAASLPGDEPLRWSSDGKSIFVLQHGLPGDRVIVRLDLATGKREDWMRPNPLSSAGLTTVYSSHISADGSTYAETYFRALSDLFLARGLH